MIIKHKQSFFMDVENIILTLSDNYKNIISRQELRKYKCLDWGNNGIGNRWCKKMFNYSVLYKSGKIKTYSEYEHDIIDIKKIEIFFNKYKEEIKEHNGIIGIFVHSKRKNIETRCIRKDIKDKINKMNCVSCGSKTDIICDHKNDLYNDIDVLNLKTQQLSHFQPLCSHCNLQKRQVNKQELNERKIYSAKNIKRYQSFPFIFPWEMKIFDIKDKTTKNDTYWYDPVEFNRKIYIYTLLYPSIILIKMIFKRKIKLI